MTVASHHNHRFSEATPLCQQCAHLIFIVKGVSIVYLITQEAFYSIFRIRYYYNIMKLICPTSSSLTLLLLVSATSAWTSSPTTTTRSTTSLAATITSRHAFLQTLTSAVVATTLLSTTTPLSAGADETLPNGVAIVVKKSGSGPKPDVGELVAIRFAAYNGDLKIDDIFDTPEPYYTRLGSGGLLKGVESVLPMMKLGDRWVLTIPVSTVIGLERL